MEIDEITARLRRIKATMAAKGWPAPQADLTFWGDRSGGDVSVFLHSNAMLSDFRPRSFSGDTPAEVIKAAEAFVASLPADETWRDEFRGHVDKAVEIAVRNIPDADTISRLQSTAADLEAIVDAWRPASKTEAA